MNKETCGLLHVSLVKSGNLFVYRRSDSFTIFIILCTEIIIKNLEETLKTLVHEDGTLCLVTPDSFEGLFLVV